MDYTIFVEAIAGLFALVSIVGFVLHRQDSSSIKEQTALGIQSIVAVTTLGITGSMAEETAEIHGKPTPDLK